MSAQPGLTTRNLGDRAMADERLADFTLRLKDNGVSEDLIQEITNRIISDRITAVSDAAQSYHLNNPTTRSSFAEKLSAMTRRCYGLSVAMTGASNEILTVGSLTFDGLVQLTMDLIESAERLERDYEALLMSGNKKTSE